MKIFQVNDCDWWMAPTLAEAVEAAAREYGYADGAAARADEMIVDERELTEADLERLKYRLEEWECECGAVLNPVSPDFRCAGSRWEHHHGYPVGHVAMRREISFKEGLARRIAAGARTEMFASTEC